MIRLGAVIIVTVTSLLTTIEAATPATTLTVKMNRVSNKGIGLSVGSITFESYKKGVLITPHLHSLPPGMHGFHIHQYPSCMPGIKNGKSVAALKAGGHYDPKHTGKHLGPYNDQGHLGDLPTLYINKNGLGIQPVFAPRIQLNDVINHAIMIHAGGDNYQDHPKALGGGGARLACGVYQEQQNHPLEKKPVHKVKISRH